jgi:hypothetical protein
MDTSAPRTRRAVISAALGGIAATALAALGRPQAAAATDNSALIVGQINLSSLNTTLQNGSGTSTTLTTTAAGSATSISGTSNAGKGVQGNTQTGTAVRAAANGTGFGIYSTSTGGRAIQAVSGSTQPSGTPDGTIGLLAFDGAGTSVYGWSVSGTAVRATTTSGSAIDASNSSSTKPTIIAGSLGSTGVVGHSGGGGVPSSIPALTGVYGDSLDTAGVGVHGRSFDGAGVVGVGIQSGASGVEGYGGLGVYGSGDWAGVLGDVDQSVGVMGWTGVAGVPFNSDIAGVWAGAENGRAALQVQGVVKMNRSGRTQIAAGAASKKVTVPAGMTSAALGFANLQTNRAGYYVQAVVVGTADSSLTIYLNKALVTATYVCWMVIG